ncbi:DUF397 domain-containing protein [Streptomyces sp. NPDC001941]|uniref:DUF397 domain-containing protein n=1 Tax=Streptomyces sp. NPDC001941 TaxID=3154659 RepID=UPI003320D952
MPKPVWRKSSYSNSNHDCVEVQDHVANLVPVRDSKRPGPQIVASAHAWQSFVDSLKG